MRSLLLSVITLALANNEVRLPVQEVCPSITREHQVAIAEITQDMIDGLISSEDALEEMRNVIPPECRATLVDQQED